ncbi:MAG TPA: glycosyltransferase [Baekduia sp.]|nr:glycosyltransferase [Baekduia sp.]
MRLWFVCPDTDVPSGGVRVIHRCVEHLRAAGREAWVVHEQPGFRPTWFTSAAPIAYAPSIDLAPGADVLVVPEIYGPGLGDIAPGVTKVIFNQNTSNTFAGYALPIRRGATAYDHPEVGGAVCVSEDEAAVLRFAFPQLAVERVVLQVDPAIFHPGPKRRVLTYMPRKGARDAARVLGLLGARGTLDDVEVRALQGLDEAGVAAAQRDALLFLSFSVDEGWGLPPVEALASGCLVVGFHGMGGREFLTPDLAWPVEQGDVLALARTAAGLLDRHREDPEPLEAHGRAAAAAIHARYTPQREAASVVAAFEALAAVPALTSR